MHDSPTAGGIQSYPKILMGPSSQCDGNAVQVVRYIYIRHWTDHPWRCSTQLGGYIEVKIPGKCQNDFMSDFLSDPASLGGIEFLDACCLGFLDFHKNK